MALASDLENSQKGQNNLSSHMSSSETNLRIYQGTVQPRNFPSLPADWISEWETFPSSDGTLQLYSVVHHPSQWNNPRVLVIFHGLGEHGGRYLHFPHYLKSTVGAVSCLDHRGHGRSEGLRGHVDRFDLFCKDVVLAIYRLNDNLIKRFNQSEIHVLGHSMGGLIVLKTLFKYSSLPIHSVTVSAPLLKNKADIPPIKKAAAYTLSRIWGSLQMTSPVNPNELSHDRDVIEAYVADRLIHKKGTPRFYTELMAAMAEVNKKDSGFNYPLQMLIPLQDQIVDPEPSLEFFRALKLRDKLLKTYPGFYHEPFNEVGKDQVFEDLIAWIRSHSTN